MRQLMLEGPGRVAWAEVAEPALEGDGDALVRPVAVARCDGDLAAYTGLAPMPMPYPAGHEFVATVVEPGPTAFQPGDLVVVPYQVSCGGCGSCKSGRTASCQTVPRLSMYGFGSLGGPWGGAISELVRVPYAGHMLVPLPEGVSPAAAANASDNLADAWRLVQPYLVPGESEVLVVGGGPSIGLWAAEVAVALGARSVTYVDTDPTRLALAEAAGATVVDGEPKRRMGEHDIAVDASGVPGGLTCCLRSTVPDGVCTSASIFFEDQPVPTLEMYSKNVTFVTGRPHSRDLLPTTLEAIATGLIDPLRIATCFEWDDAPAAFASDAPKAVIVRER